MYSSAKLLKILSFLLYLNLYADSDQVNVEFTNVETEDKSLVWNVKHNTWTQEHEKAYSKFIYEIGQSLIKKKCKRVNACLYTVGKKLYPLRTPEKLRLASYNKNGGYDDDCSKAPFFTRAFFAYLNHLPFAWPVGYEVIKPNKNREIRMSTNGTKVLGWDHVISGEDTLPSVLRKLIKVPIFSVYYRVSAKEEDRVSKKAGIAEDAEYDENNFIVHPFYSVEITRESMTPGTLLYSANFGHITTIREVTEEGEIKLIGSHPGAYTSTPRFGKHLFKSKSNDSTVGNGFFKWRNYEIINYTRDENDNIQGGQYRALVGEENFYFGNEQFDFYSKKDEEENYNYFNYIQNLVGDINVEIDLLTRFKQRMGELCESIKARHATVQEAFDHGINLKKHPLKLPENIYATSIHEWELYSTPSRDMAFKGNIISNLDYIKRLVKRYNE